MAIDEPVLIDTGPLIALLNAKDDDHERGMEVFDILPIGKAYTCWPVLTEAVYLAMSRLKLASPNELFNTIVQHELVLMPLALDDLPSIQSVFRKYHDQHVDLADAAIVHLADRENIGTIFTTDRRHFRVYQRANGNPFRLLPDDFAP